MMTLFYNFFTGTGTAGDVAWSLATLVIRKFNVAADTAAIVQSLTWKLRSLAGLFKGNVTIWDALGVIPDLAELIVNFLPAGRIVDVIQIITGSVNIL